MRRLHRRVLVLLVSGLLAGVTVEADTASGGLAPTRDLSSPAGPTALSPHGRWLVGRLPGTRDFSSSVESTALSPDGRWLAVGTENSGVFLLDSNSLKTVRHLPTDNNALCFSPDNNLLATSRSGETAVVWDIPSGRTLLSLDHHSPVHSNELECLAFSHDRRLITTGTYWGEVYLWDVANGRCVEVLKNKTRGVACLSFSADDRLLLATSRDGVARAWEVLTGGEVTTWERPGQGVRSPAFGLDGDTVVWCEPDYSLCLVSLRTGREKARLSGHQAPVSEVAVSASLRLLVSSDVDHTVRVWDVESGEEVKRLEAAIYSMKGVGLSARGDRVAWGSGATLHVEDSGLLDDGRGNAFSRRVSTRLSAPALSPAGLDALWAKLSNLDARRAYEAVFRLEDAPHQAVSLLRSRLAPAQTVPADRLARLLGHLDDDNFEVRERATHELAGLGELAEPALRKALAASPPPEARRRIELLLQPLQERVPPPESLRQLRALAVLEHIGTSEARDLLAAIAKGAEGARVTREARASLERLGK